MGVPGFYSWLTKRYPMIKQMINQQSIPQIDYLYLDMNGIIYKCVRDDSIIFKSQLMPKELEEMWVEIFNYINMLVDKIKPTKMIMLALDGVAPRCKMNNQRSRRFRSAQDYKEYIQRLYGYTDMADSQENFKNNSISPGTSFMHQLNQMLHFFIEKKIQEDDYWKGLSVVFTGSDTPGEGEHKIMQFMRGNQQNFMQDDTHCFYGADADLIMLGLTLPIKNALIIREEYIHASQKVQIMSTRKQKQINFQLIYLSILKECFDIEYHCLKDKMQVEYNIDKIARDFVFLFFFVGNDFLPRIYAYNIREKSIEKMIQGFKEYLVTCESYITDGTELNMKELLRLLGEVGKYQSQFFSDKQMEFEKMEKHQQKNFQDELQKLFMAKIKYEKQTLMGLRQMQLNTDGTGRHTYYTNYFRIDPSVQAEELWNILAYYVYGLKFVYEYYFRNLASWSWYYPYYFAPLLSDIQYYLGFVTAQNIPFVQFQLDRPFEPFKQLLCILPKESADLLPQNYRKYIVEANSQLRNPIDFYPDHVETVTYGSVRAHEAIYLIPFLDQSVICDVYDREITNTSEKDKARNVLNPSTLYEYSDKNDKRNIVSPFASISNFTSKCSKKFVNLIQKITWKTKDNKSTINEGDQNLFKMPSLKMRDFQILSKNDDKSKITFKLMLSEKQKQKFKLGEQIYYGYPLEHSGRIQAVLVKNNFIYTKDFDMTKYDFIYKNTNERYVEDLLKRPKEVFMLIRDKISHDRPINHTFYSFIDLSSTDTFLFIAETKTFARTVQGQFRRLFADSSNENFTIIPACVASKQKSCQSTLSIHKFKGIEEQFRLGEQVLCIPPDLKLCGAKGKVMGYEKGQVRIEMIEEPRYQKDKLAEIINLLSTKADINFSLRFVAQILGIKFDHLENFLGNISIITPKESKLPPSIDIGLNLMSRREQKIVPNLVRVNFHENFQAKRNNPFRFLQISIRGLEILVEYKRKFPEIFQFMQERHKRLVNRSKEKGQKIDWDEPIYAEKIYPENSAKNLMKVYKWLVEMQETHMPASSLYSKQVNLKRIKKLKKIFTVAIANKQIKPKQSKKFKQKAVQFLMDPNFLFSHRLSQLGYPYLKKRPQNHEIGDLVICITPQFFGHYGAIVGIDDNKYEVFFDEPSFGKGDLGGLCQNLWGAKFEYRQLLNLSTWPALFSQRIKGATQMQKLGWNGIIEDYLPKYNSKPFENFHDLKVFLGREENKKYFNEDLINYIFQVQKKIKQTPLEQDFTVVDNRKGDHRYKYDQKKQYIDKKQVEQAAEVIKVLEQSPETIVPVEQGQPKHEEIFKEVETEIIQNKVEEDNAEEIGDQEDGQDILG